MDGRTKERLIYGLPLSGLTVGVLLLLTVSRDKGVASGVIQAVVAVGTAYFTVLALLWRRAAQRRAGRRDVEICQALAEIVERRSRQLAGERQLLAPNPIPLTWTLAQDGISGPIADLLPHWVQS